MDLQFDKHAEDRMASRQVTPEDVEWALRRPVGDPISGHPGSLWIRGYAAGGRILKVCVSAADRNYIKTVVWESE